MERSQWRVERHVARFGVRPGGGHGLERAPRSGAPDYLPQLQQELLAVIARYELIDLGNVSVNLDHSGGTDVLELNIILPDKKPATPTSPSHPAVS